MIGWLKKFGAPQRNVEKQLQKSDEQAEENNGYYSIPGKYKYNPDDLIGAKGASIYRRMMMDEQVKAVVRFRRDAITSRDYYFDTDSSVIGDDEALRRERIFEQIVDSISGSFTDKLNGIMTAEYQGFSYTEKVYSDIVVDGRTYVGIRDLKLRPFDSIKFNTDSHGNIVGVVQEVNGKTITLDRSRFIHMVCNPEYDPHYGGSELREAYRYWLSKDLAIKFYNMWLERHASGHWTFKPQEGKRLTEGSREYTQLQRVIENTVNGVGMIIPSGIDETVVYPNNNVAYKEAITLFDLGIARTMLVPNLLGITPSGQTGSYSQSETQFEAFMWTLDATASRIEEVLNEHLFKELGEYNFGDEYWPKFKLRKLSQQQTMTLFKTWSELVTKGAVKSTDEDDSYIRRLLNFPSSSTADEQGASYISATKSLDGAQVSSLVDLVAKIKTGEITKTAALEIIVSAFPINRAQAEAMLADVGEDMAPAQQTGPFNNNAAGMSGIGKKREDGTDVETEPDLSRRGIVKRGFISASKRIAFEVIDSQSSNIENAAIDNISDIFSGMISGIVDGIDDVANIDIGDIRFDKKDMRSLNKSLSSSLSNGWAIGEKHAKDELDKARKKFTLVDTSRLKFVSEEFFKIRSFKAIGDLTGKALSIIQNEILNAAKYDKTIADAKESIYYALASNGYLPERLYSEIDPAGKIKNPQANIDTMVRTNVFEAVNEARYAYFTDPQQSDFVEAFEYSAILDSRTTQICRELDGKIYRADSEYWKSLRPLNHYNCRSILVPITAVDVWRESDPLPDDIEPQRGFG